MADPLHALGSCASQLVRTLQSIWPLFFETVVAHLAAHWLSVLILARGSELCVTMGIGAFVAVFAHSVLFKMSTFGSFVVGALDWGWYVLEVLLLLLRLSVVAAILLISLTVLVIEISAGILHTASASSLVIATAHAGS